MRTVCSDLTNLRGCSATVKGYSQPCGQDEQLPKVTGERTAKVGQRNVPMHKSILWGTISLQLTTCITISLVGSLLIQCVFFFQISSSALHNVANSNKRASHSGCNGQVRLLSHNQVHDSLTFLLCPRGLGILEDRDDHEPNSHILQTTQTMSNLSRKLRQMASGIEIGPSSCTRSNRYRICRLTASHSNERTDHRRDQGHTRHRK